MENSANLDNSELINLNNIDMSMIKKMDITKLKNNISKYEDLDEEQLDEQIKNICICVNKVGNDNIKLKRHLASIRKDIRKGQKKVKDYEETLLELSEKNKELLKKNN